MITWLPWPEQSSLNAHDSYILFWTIHRITRRWTVYCTGATDMFKLYLYHTTLSNIIEANSPKSLNNTNKVVELRFCNDNKTTIEPRFSTHGAKLFHWFPMAAIDSHYIHRRWWIMWPWEQPQCFAIRKGASASKILKENVLYIFIIILPALNYRPTSYRILDFLRWHCIHMQLFWLPAKEHSVQNDNFFLSGTL